MVSRGKWALGALTCLAAVLAAATFAQAAVQSPKNGCSSDVGYEGSLTSPDFTPTSPTANDPPNVSLQGWFEIESIDPIGHDQVVLEWSLPGDPDRFWQEFAKLNPTTSPGAGAADHPVSNLGLDQPPQFQSYNFELPIEARNMPGVQVRVRFATGDGAYNGFRGAGVDAVALEGAGVTYGFEANLGGWSVEPVSPGPGEPFWQELADTQDESVSPAVNPPLVTLPDSGALPETPFGDKYAWFGHVDSGTFCGPDFANLDPAPDTAITSAPPGSTASNDATFEFSSTEGGFFECELDGGGFSFCSSPQTYPGLAEGTHTFAVRATDFSGNVDPTPATHTWTIRPAELSDLDDPTMGVDVNVDQVAGIVKVAIPSAAARAAGAGRASQKGLTFVPLSEARQVPVGSFLDTRKGTVRLESATNSAGKRQRGTFLSGLFQVRQSRKRSARGLTDLILKGSSFRRCRAASSKGAVASLSRRQIRRLRANARGNFRTSGSNSSATVRGTVWDTIDRCDGTLTKVRRGKVVVRDFRRKKNITLTAGKSYLAKAPQR